MREPTYEEGVYGVKITGQKLGQSSGGTPQFVLSFEPCWRENPNAPEGQEGQWVQVESSEERAYFYLSEAAAQYSIPKLRRLGFVLPEPRVELLDEDTPGFLSRIGESVRLQCKHREYNGEWKTDWDVAKAQSVACDNDTIRDMNALFGREFSAPVSAPAQPPVAPILPTARASQPQPPLTVHPDPIPDGSPGPASNPSPEPPPVSGEGAEDLPF